MQKYITQKTETSFCDGIQSLIHSGESVRFFAPLAKGTKVKEFEASEHSASSGIQVGINEAGREGLVCFYFVDFPKAGNQEFTSGIVLLSLVRDRNQLAALFNPTKLASLLKVDFATAKSIIQGLKKDFLSFQRLRLMYGVYQLMQPKDAS